MRALLGRLALVAGSLGVGLAMAEAVLGFLLNHAALAAGLSGNLLSHLRAYYLRHDRVLLQSLPECSRYDPELFYTLRPGRCGFANREYDTVLFVNSAGLRDTEESLRAPEVVVLGDSFTTGWGVGQEEAFPQQLARLSGRRVLNAGVPSYGTVREIELLDRIDTSRLRTLVVQYDDNDSEENAVFREQRNRLAVKPERAFVHDVQRAGTRHRYYFGKYSCEIVRAALDPERAAPSPPAPRRQAQLFLNALVHASRCDLSGVQVVVLDLNADRLITGELVRAIAEEAVRGTYPAFVRRLRVLDLAGRILPDDYFVLDDHLRASGHRKVAEALLQAGV